MPMAPQRVVSGVHLGRTKIKAGAVEFSDQQLTSDHLVAHEEVSTPRVPPKEFYDAIAQLVIRVRQSAQATYATTLPLVGVAHPGRFLPDGSLARGTTPNLGTAPGQFDGLKPAHELEQRLHIRVVAENDAVSQMRFGLELLLRDPATRSRLLGETVVYLGPGTGMGGGVAQVSPEGTVMPVTDGHFFDLQVAGYSDGTLTAEELFTGPAIARLVREANQQLAKPIEPARAGGLDELLKSPTSSAEHRAIALRIAAQEGDILARIVALIHAGQITKVRLETLPDPSTLVRLPLDSASGPRSGSLTIAQDSAPRAPVGLHGRVQRYVDEPERAWSEADRTLVRGARRFILGGFVGSSLALGKAIRARALERLQEQGLRQVELFQIPMDSADAGVLGAVRAISDEEVRHLRVK